MILIINNHSRNIFEIKKILSKLGANYKVKDQRTILKKSDHKDVKGVILSGGGPDLDKKVFFDQIRADMECLVNFDVPVLGICEGYEIMAESCGAEIVTLKKPARYEKLEVEILVKSDIFRGLPDRIYVYEHHSMYVKNVSDDLIVSATSGKNRIEAIFHKKKPFFGLQFHPEMSGESGEKIFRNFIKICDNF